MEQEDEKEDEEESLDNDGQAQRQRRMPKEGLWGLILRPIYWFKMLGDEFHWSFLLGVVFVSGINQGVGIGLIKVGLQYYMKDDQKLQPSEAQFLFGLIKIPWIIKPVWGILTDIVPINGYRRRPYFIFAGFIGVIGMLVLSLHQKLWVAYAILSLMAMSTGVAIADATMDACVTENSISHPSLAGDMQSLCGLSSSIGALIGFPVSGFLVRIIGSKGVFGVLSIPSGLLILVGMTLRESVVRNSDCKRVSQKFLDAGKAIWTALKCQDVWKACSYMYLSLALNLNISEGMFYWNTDAKEGPSFSQEVIGSIFSVGAFGSLFGVLLYQTIFKSYPFRQVILWSQLLYCASGMLDFILVLRLNLKFGVPDFLFVIISEFFRKMIERLKWMPLLVLSSKLCCSGIEGTFFALLMSIDHVGLLTSSWAGGLSLHVLNITRTEFHNMWMAILGRSFLRILPTGLLFLVPAGDPNASIISNEMLTAKQGDDTLDSENKELTPLVHNT